MTTTVDLLTEEQAAQRLLISPRTLHGLRKAGLIRYVALTARKIAYRPEDCDEYVAARLRVESPRSNPSPQPKRKPGRAGPVHGNVLPFSQRKRGSG